MNETTHPSDASPTWHAQPPQVVLERLESRAEGLDEAEASRRLAAHGANRIPLRSAALLGHLVDAGVIAGVVFVDGLIGVIQEGKAEKALVRNRAGR